MSTSNQQSPQPKGRLLQLTLIAAFAILVVWFTIQNADTISFQFATWTWQVSLALLLFASLFIGILLACIVVLPQLWSERRYRKKIDKQFKTLEADKNALQKENTALTGERNTLREERDALRRKLGAS